MKEPTFDLRIVKLEVCRDEVCNRIDEVEEELATLKERRAFLTDRIKRRSEGEDV